MNPKLFRLIFIMGSIAGIAGVILLYYREFKYGPDTLTITVTKLQMEIIEKEKELESIKQQLIQEISEKKKIDHDYNVYRDLNPPRPPPPPPPASFYGIQVANCFSMECVDYYKFNLAIYGHTNLKYTSSIRSTNVIEVYFEKEFDLIKAQSLAEAMERYNNFIFWAWPIKLADNFAVSIGNYVTQKMANIVKNDANKKSELNFVTRKNVGDYPIITVVIGYYSSKIEAQNVRNNLVKRDARFSNTFVFKK